MTTACVVLAAAAVLLDAIAPLPRMSGASVHWLAPSATPSRSTESPSAGCTVSGTRIFRVARRGSSALIFAVAVLSRCVCFARLAAAAAACYADHALARRPALS